MDTLQQVPLTASLVYIGAVAGSTNTWTNTVASQCAIRGKFIATQLGTNNAASITPTLDSNTGVTFVAVTPDKCAAIVFGVDSTGGATTVRAVQGPLMDTYAGVTTTVGAFKGAPQFPPIPDDFCPIAYTVVRCAPSLSAGFVLGSTQWAASSVSCATFVNIVTLPDRPQIA
jgi:hypothetical protein